MDAATSGVLKTKEKLVRENLAKIATKTEDEKIRLLIRSLASSYLLGEFNQISRAIYQGQLEILVKMNAAPAGVRDADARLFYDEVKLKTGKFYDGYSYDQFMGFLTKNNLSTFREGLWFIAEYGDEFLKHLVTTKQTYPRIG